MESENKNGQRIKGDQIVSRTLELINSRTTMTLATAKNDSAWAAPVYYAYRRGFFYFFSNPEARHIVEGLITSQSSAAIHSSSKEWRDICGIQMAGKIRTGTARTRSKKCFWCIYEKIPVLQGVLFPRSVAGSDDIYRAV